MNDAHADAAEARPRTPDAGAIEAMQDVVSVHVNLSHWWNNASFMLPLLVAVVSLAIGLLGVGEAIGFGLFALGVTVLLLPVVALTWRRTPTAVVLTRRGATALHSGRVLREIDWTSLTVIERADYGNVRWRLRPREGDHLSIEAELSGIDSLIDHAYDLSGLPREGAG